MMELVDMRDLGSRVERRWGSSPHARTNLSQVDSWWSALVCQDTCDFELLCLELCLEYIEVRRFL